MHISGVSFVFYEWDCLVSTASVCAWHPGSARFYTAVMCDDSEDAKRLLCRRDLLKDETDREQLRPPGAGARASLKLANRLAAAG